MADELDGLRAYSIALALYRTTDGGAEPAIERGADMVGYSNDSDFTATLLRLYRREHAWLRAPLMQERRLTTLDERALAEAALMICFRNA